MSPAAMKTTVLNMKNITICVETFVHTGRHFVFVVILSYHSAILDTIVVSPKENTAQLETKLQPAILALFFPEQNPVMESAMTKVNIIILLKKDNLPANTLTIVLCTMIPI